VKNKQENKAKIKEDVYFKPKCSCFSIWQLDIMFLRAMYFDFEKSACANHILFSQQETFTGKIAIENPR
jgi:hypothetical protein